MLLDLVNLLGEAVVQQAIRLVHDQGVQVGRLDAGVWVRKDVEQTAGSADEDVAALALRLLEHHALLGSSNRGLHAQAGVLGELFGLEGDLLGELAGGGDDDGPDVAGSRALVAAGLLAELGVACDDALDDGNEEPECLAGTRLCLCDAARCQSVVPVWEAAMAYTSTPLRASLMVRCWTSVMVWIFIDLVMVLTMLGCTRPRVASSENSVTGPSSAIASSARASCATCCHLALL